MTSSIIFSFDLIFWFFRTLLVEVVEEGDGQASAPGGRFVLGRIDHPMKRRAPSVVGPSSHQVAQIDDETIFLRDCDRRFLEFWKDWDVKRLPISPQNTHDVINKGSSIASGMVGASDKWLELMPTGPNTKET